MQAKTYLGSAARRLLASSSASRTFDSFLAANPPPSAAPPEDSWTRNEGGQHAAGAGHPHAHVPCGEPRRFHWRQAQAEAAQLARSHDLQWSSDMDGYLCLPKQGDFHPAAAAAAAEEMQQADHTSARLSEQQQQQQQQSACTATTTAAAATAQQMLLLKLPPVLWGSVHMPQGRLHDVSSGKAAPGLQLIVLLSADSAALAVCSEGAIVRHKTMTGAQWLWPACCQAAVPQCTAAGQREHACCTGYTVRRNRNGKAQLTYRRTKTGSSTPQCYFMLSNGVISGVISNTLRVERLAYLIWCHL